MCLKDSDKLKGKLSVEVIFLASLKLVVLTKTFCGVRIFRS